MNRKPPEARIWSAEDYDNIDPETGVLPEPPQPHAAGPGRQPAPVKQGPETWEQWKEWHTNPSGHGGGGARRGPPIFVKALGHELAASEVQIVVEAPVLPDAAATAAAEAAEKTKLDGAGVADWYMSLFTGKKKEEGKPTTTAEVATITAAASRAADASPIPRPHAPPPPSDSPLPRDPSSASTTTSASASTSVSTSASATASTSSPSTPPPMAPAPIKIRSSEWFIRRALVNKPAEAARSSTPSSIASLVNIDRGPRAAPASRFSYALGPDNAGYARLEKLGWAGGGLGKPEGWDGDVFVRPGSRPSRPESAPPAVSASTSTSASASGSVSDASPAPGSADEEDANPSDEDGVDEEEHKLHGPGRVAPIATVLKVDRAGLGRKSGKKKITHTPKEIERAYRRSRGQRAPATHRDDGEMTKREKLKWKDRDRRDRETRARIAAILNS